MVSGESRSEEGCVASSRGECSNFCERRMQPPSSWCLSQSTGPLIHNHPKQFQSFWNYFLDIVISIWVASFCHNVTFL
jgi:hypothetical protein